MSTLWLFLINSQFIQVFVKPSTGSCTHTFQFLEIQNLCKFIPLFFLLELFKIKIKWMSKKTIAILNGQSEYHVRAGSKRQFSVSRNMHVYARYF